MEKRTVGRSYCGDLTRQEFTHGKPLLVSQQGEESQVIATPQSMMRERKEVPDQIKSEWLGVEARVHLPPRVLADNCLINSRRWYAVGGLLFSFLSGIAMGGCLALFVSRVEAGPVMPDMVKAMNPSEC
jgi:hypothetical protein